MKRICFLFNHDQTHQIAHSLPIAMAMARTGAATIVVAATEDSIEARIREIAGPDMQLFQFVRLGLTSRTSRMLSAGLEAVVPARKLLIYRDNLDFFRRFDALVVSEKTSLLLKTRYGLDALKIIHTRHGAGDRAIGFGRESALFDLVLVAGPKIARRLVRDAGVDPERIRITGYSKFDLFADRRIALPFADPVRPTVLYNPHPSPKLSSWFAMGERVLRELGASGRYNVIFAPHVMLFARKWTVTIAPPAVRRTRMPEPSLFDREEVMVDLGSTASTDMSYTNSADIYVGDVSSQVYEFLKDPRPCLHLDAHGIDWRENPDYTHWRSGPVAGRDADIVAAVDEAVATHADYLPVQQELLTDTFSVTGEPASSRAARAIAEFLDD